MKLKNIALITLCLSLCFVSCKKDDDTDDDIVVIEENDRTEQQVIDNASIIGYLETHYYNSDDFDETNLDPSISDLVFTELADGETTAPTGHTLLIDELQTTTNPDGKLELHDAIYEDTDYEYYILRLNQGGGTDSPSFSDNVFVLYEGFTLDNTVFDNKINLDDDDPFDLLGLIKGWSLVLPQFNTTESYIENNDGTVEFTNHGTGVMFLPSGLGYFSSSTVGSSYAPLIFKFELIFASENDHDGDGVPSYLEDLNDDGEFTIADADDDAISPDDTDGDGFPDYFDNDDDGDGTLTIYEDLDEDGDPTNDDTDGDGIPNYLDTDDTESNQA